MNSPRRILIRLPNWLGDALLARPLLHALEASFPLAELAAVGSPSLLELLDRERAFGARHPWPPAGRDRRALTALLARWSPDVAVVLPPSFSSAWLAWRARARVRVGYADEGRGPLLTHALARPPRGERHLSDEYLELGRVLGAREVAVPELPVSPEAREAARGLLASRGLDPAGPLVLLAPGATYGPAKRWPADRFAAVGRRLASRGLAVLVCGAAAEAATCAEVAGAIGSAAIDLAGATGLPELSALCAAARVAVCNDSGLAHLAAAVGTPTVVVFGSTSSAWTAPRGERVSVVQRPPVCSPCFAPTCRIGYACLAAVTERMVERACDRLLEVAAA